MASYFYLKSNLPIINIKIWPPTKIAYTLKAVDSQNYKDSRLKISAQVKAYDISERVLSGSRQNSGLVLGWIPFWDQDTAFATFKQNADLFTHVSLFWYLLRSDGSVKKYIYAQEDTSIINFARARGVKVLALVANLPDEDEGGDWDAARVNKVISSEAARKKHVTDLVNLAKKHNFDGINIDYEALKGYQKTSFTLFIKDLANNLHQNGKILAVALHPKPRENDPAYSNGSQAQDWEKLAGYADQLHLMTYEQHWETSGPGPISAVPWVRSILDYAKKLIPSYKLFAGVPLYGYDWGGSAKAEGLTYQEVQNLIKRYKPKIVWDASAKTYHFSYIVGGISHAVWYEDDASFNAKMDLFNEISVPNVAFWRLGGEDTRVWSSLRNSP
ncbi:MAG: hypothetical protein A2Z11_04145 [Candidatus Woykebacteria bacterium RBG_16_43_9]|uniref:GH18 domain-containing protein n=1 Tax=Candidatus Woykebacteria bacterium RBG_16_43_9 TaxID=1802596 RepID=A0A1G1WEI1_9BACT|nr:MAG: hypothetical protein A2Z11_04145 [Candidatus Woykebacteria bacterium RBG_16_43_9]